MALCSTRIKIAIESDKIPWLFQFPESMWKIYLILDWFTHTHKLESIVSIIMDCMKLCLNGTFNMRMSTLSMRRRKEKLSPKLASRTIWRMINQIHWLIMWMVREENLFSSSKSSIFFHRNLTWAWNRVFNSLPKNSINTYSSNLVQWLVSPNKCIKSFGNLLWAMREKNQTVNHSSCGLRKDASFGPVSITSILFSLDFYRIHHLAISNRVPFRLIDVFLSFLSTNQSPLECERFFLRDCKFEWL